MLGAQKGLELEIFYSQKIHQKEIPLLVSPNLLRSIGVGQVDIASFKQEVNGEFVIKLYEIKNSIAIKAVQKRRLEQAAHYLSSIFDLNVQLIYLFGAKEFCQTA